MQDRPTAIELLAAVRRFLDEVLVPELDGTRRFHARVAANVLGIVARELRDGEAQLRTEWARLRALLGEPEAPPPASADALAVEVRLLNTALAERIRAGEADAGTFRVAVLAHLRTTAVDRLRIANPRHLETP